MIFGHVTINMADGFISPFFAVFVTLKIADGSVSVVGYAIAIYWFIKSVIQLPIARFLDKTDGEKDDYAAMILGAFLFFLFPIIYIFVKTPVQLYLTQVLMAVAGSLYVVPWNAIFTRHVDKFRIGFEWSLNSSALGFGLMAATATGGYLAERFGYNMVFIIAACINFIGAVSLIFLSKYITQKNRIEKVFPESHEHHRRMR